MKTSAWVLATLGAVLGALGQICFKYGADGRGSLSELINTWIALGVLLYSFGTVLWILALSTAPLTKIYPFTALTFVLVNIFGILMLGERLSGNAMVGVALILIGLLLIAT